jgi:hypothetical protein
MTIASVLTDVLTDVTVTVTASDKDEAAADDESDAWEAQRADRERAMSREVNAIVQTCSRGSGAEK